MTDGTSDSAGEPFSLADWIVSDVTAFVTPLLEASSSPAAAASLLNNIGWQTSALPALVTLINDVSAAVDAALSDLDTAAGGAQDGSESTGLGLLQNLIGSIQGISTAIAGLSQAASGPDPPAGLDRLAEDMLAWLTDNYLVTTHPLLHGALALLQLLTPQAAAPEQPAVPGSAGQVVRSAYRIPALHLDRVGALLRDPEGYLRGIYLASGTLVTPADVQQLADALFPVVADALNSFGIGAQYGLDPYFDQLGLDQATTAILQHGLSMWMLDSTDSDATRLGVTFALVGPDATTAGRLGAVIAPLFPTAIDGMLGGWNFTVELTANGAPLSVISWTPYPADTANWPGLGLALTLAAGATADPSAAPGTPTPPSAKVTVQTSVAGSAFDASLSVSLQGTASVSPADVADGFLQTILPSSGIVIPLGLTLTGTREGWKLEGSAPTGKAVVLADYPAIPLGPLMIDDLRFQVTPEATGLVVGGYLTASLYLGPVMAHVQDLGVGLEVGWPAGGGNAGPLDIRPQVLWPSGIGLGLQAPPVTGVGFIAFDQADARYLGAIALQVGDVGISAVGVLDTRLPGGATGYSLIVVASAQFPPIQLGFGFSLSAIGGLVGINRTADVPTLQALARAGRIDDLMFPADLVHRAPQVAANLAQQFPVAQGHFIVGPAVQIQWGTGGLVYADIGVFIELSDSGGGVTVLRIALLGLVHLTLPEGAAPVADITLDVLGVLDFAAKTLSLDAGLRNSTIATYPLTGQAALRAGWGSNPEFLFAVGGFNPCFQAPAGFPALQRITLSIGGDNPRLRLSAYLALTSNTLQLGCAADVYASAQEAGVTAAVSASLTFDALVQFKPFGLIVDLTINAAILINNNPIMTLSLYLHVTGPDPWTVTGSASFHFLFASVTIPISIGGGQPPPPQPATPVDLDGNLLTALADPRSWATGPPAGRSLVRVRSQDTAGAAVHPLGSLTVRQRAVPLGQRIDCYGPDPVKACRYEITGTDLGVRPVTATAVSDYFAPAQFRTMNDQQKLSSPSFESMTSGATLGTAGLSLAPIPAPGQTPPPPVVDSVSTTPWETLTLDSPDPAPSAAARAAPAGPPPPVTATPGHTSVPDQLLAAQLGGAAAARSGPAGQPEAIYASPGIGIAVQDPYYFITGLDLGVLASTDLDSLTAGLTAAAQARYRQDWQIVYTSEVG
jgi:hypothetical protein